MNAIRFLSVLRKTVFTCLWQQMCEYKLCFLYWSVYVICCLLSAVSSVFSCREDETAVQINSNISLALLLSLTCTHFCMLASVSGKTICGSERGTEKP